jgi:APA family basic amino acid/polyamine antiporter
MARRGDLFSQLSIVNRSGTTPHRAVLAVGLLIAGIAAVGEVRTTWSFSAFSVLVYYALTNLAALRMPAESRLFPRFVAAIGLAACLGLAFFVDAEIWLVGLGLIAIGAGWHAVARRAAAPSGER